MTLRSPVLAMLWENWRLTRVEAAWRLTLGIVAASAMLAWSAAIAPQPEQVGARTSESITEFGVAMALALIILPAFLPWISTTALKGGRLGGFGFPFYLNFTRPVPTAVLVGVPMAYLAALAAALYVVSALVLRWIFDHPFPVLPMAASIAVLHLALAAADWSTRRYLAGHLGVGTVNLAFMVWLSSRGGAIQWLDGGLKSEAFRRWPAQFDFSFPEYGFLAAIGVTSIGVAIARVARQRRGDDARAAVARSWTAGAGFSDRIVSLFRFPCPTSSATRAQLWFELRSRGLPVLTIGVVLAIVIPLLFAVSVPLPVKLRFPAAMFALFSVVTALLLGGNAFGIRWRPGHRYVSAFEATQPNGTGQLAGLKVLVRSFCMLAALVAVAASAWASLRFIAVGEGYEPLRSWQRAIDSALGGLTGYQAVAVAVVVSIGAAVIVAWLAAVVALAARYPRRVNLAGLLMLLHGLMLGPMALNYQGVGSTSLWEFQLDVFVWVTRWIDTPVIVLATIYISWKAFAERLLTLRSAGGAIAISAAFGSAWVTVLSAAGVQPATMSTMNALWMLSPVLLPLTASALAPWSLSRARHT